MTSLLLIIIYLSFISLGLPDALLGAAWPSMYQELGASVSWAGIISMIISAGTIVSSFASDLLTRKLGTGKVTAISVCLTCLALLVFRPSLSCPALFTRKGIKNFSVSGFHNVTAHSYGGHGRIASSPAEARWDRCKVLNRVGGIFSPLSHHRTCRSAYGGST